MVTFQECRFAYQSPLVEIENVSRVITIPTVVDVINLYQLWLLKHWFQILNIKALIRNEIFKKLALFEGKISTFRSLAWKMGKERTCYGFMLFETASASCQPEWVVRTVLPMKKILFFQPWEKNLIFIERNRFF